MMPRNATARSASRRFSRPVAAPAPPPAPVSRVERVWSRYQSAVFADVATGEGHTVVQARAGSGKTSTIVEAFNHVPAGLSVLMVAFNKSIATELAARAPAGVTVCTLHSFGMRALSGSFRGARLDQYRVEAMVKARVGDAKETYEYRGALVRAISLAKGMLASAADEILSIVDSFDLDIADSDRGHAAEDALAILDQCKAVPVRSFDYDDMIWLPVVLGMNVPQFARVFVDETQDLNAAQIQLAMMACEEGGRICAVGDDRQSIYQFRGADKDAMPRVISALGAKVLPLSITYRCARSIVDVARTIVSDFEAAEGAIDGEVIESTIEKMKVLAGPGDFVLSRVNAPLVGLCLAFIGAGKPATVAGRDVGKGLVALIDKSNARTIGDLTEWVDAWEEKEIARLSRKRNSEAQIDAASDRAACVHTLCEGCDSISALRSKIDTLFSDTDDARRIVLSTTHKAKGLERDRAFVLRGTYKPSKGSEEANLYYVAVTRAKRSLYLIS